MMQSLKSRVLSGIFVAVATLAGASVSTPADARFLGGCFPVTVTDTRTVGNEVVHQVTYTFLACPGGTFLVGIEVTVP